MQQFMRVTMQDGQRFDIPVEIIARNRAAVYAPEFNCNIDKSLAEDTRPLFEDEFEIRDWATNNMNWCDLEPHAIALPPDDKPDMQALWNTAEIEIVTKIDDQIDAGTHSG